MEERCWRPVPKAERDASHLKSLSKKAQSFSLTRTSRSRPRRSSMIRIEEEFCNVQFWNFDTWVEVITRASNKMRFEYCLDARGEPQYLRSIQGHSGVPEVIAIPDVLQFVKLLDTIMQFKIGPIEARHHKDGKGRECFQVLGSQDSYTHAHVPETAKQLRETESVI